MLRKNCFHHSQRRRLHICILAFCWFSCTILGVYVSANDTNISSLMRIAAYSDVSIVGLSIVLLVPFFFVAVGLFIHMSVALYVISAIKAFSSAYLLYGIIVAFGNAGWLMHSLLLFSDTGANILYLWFIFHHIDGRKHTLYRDIVFSLCLCITIEAVDCLLIVPLLRSLLG